MVGKTNQLSCEDLKRLFMEITCFKSAWFELGIAQPVPCTWEAEEDLKSF